MRRLRKLGLPLLLPQSASLFLLLFVLTLTTILQAWPTNFFRGSRIGYGRHIRPIHCVDKTKRIGGMCMFAWDCMKANGTHLGTCIDRFYFGSCCKIEPSSYPHPHPHPLEEEDITPVETTEEEEIYADNAQTVSESLPNSHSGIVLIDDGVSSKYPSKTGETMISDTDITPSIPDGEVKSETDFVKPEVESDIISSQTFDPKFNKTVLKSDSDSATFEETDSESADDHGTSPVSDSQKITTSSPDTSKLPNLSDDNGASEGEVLDDKFKPGFTSESGSEPMPSDSTLNEESNLENAFQVEPAPEEETESIQTLNDSGIAPVSETEGKPEFDTQHNIQDMNNIFTGSSKIPSIINTVRPLIVEDRHQTTFKPDLTTVPDIFTETTGDTDYLLIQEFELDSEMQTKPGTEPPTEMLPELKPVVDLTTESVLESEIDPEQTTDSTSANEQHMTFNLTNGDIDPSHVIDETTIQYKPEEGFEPFGLENIEPETEISEVQEVPDHQKSGNESSKVPIDDEKILLEDGENIDKVTTHPISQDEIIEGGNSTISFYHTTESIFESEKTSPFVEIQFPEDVLPGTTGVMGETSPDESTKPDSQSESTTTVVDKLDQADTSEGTPSEDFTSIPIDEAVQFETSTIESSETTEAETLTTSFSEDNEVTTAKPGDDFSPVDESTPEIVTKPTTTSYEESTQAISSSEEKPTEIPNSWDEVKIIIHDKNVTSSLPPTSTEVSSSSSSASSASPVEGELESSTVAAAAAANMSTTIIEHMSPSEQEKLLVEMLKIANYKDICGKPVYPISRIVGGLEASYGEWPWQVSLRQWRSVAFLHKCGSALVNENWAITAAHCVEGIEPDQLLLVMGEYDLGTTKEPYGHVERSVQVIAMHPKFEPRTFEYDLALLRFSEPVTFQPNIIPICIPEDDYNFLNNTGFVTGWGRLYEDGPLPTVMQKVPVPVIPNSDCEEMYKEAGYIEHIPNIFICAGYQGGKQDSCEGDSGGPMVINYKHRWRLAGIISWGIGCAVPNQPGVYTRISEFREWINKIIRF